MSASRVQAMFYGGAGFGVGFLVLVYLLAALSYGAPLDFLVCVAAGSSAMLIVAAIRSLSEQHRGRSLALFAALALGILVPPVIRELVPQHNINPTPSNVVLLITYLLLLSFVLFYPQPLRFSFAGFFTLLVGFALFAYITYVGCPAKSGLLIYAFDGARWLTYPPDSPTYPYVSAWRHRVLGQ